MLKLSTTMRTVAFVAVLLFGGGRCCDLEEFFSEKQVSVEDSTKEATVVVRGLSTNAAIVTPSLSDARGVYTAYFELINTYKGDSLDIWDINSYRQINVTIFSRPVADCKAKDDIPREYIVFCQVLNGHLRALAIAKWDEPTDQRVWAALGWSPWSEWSGCSVSCSAGIQQRVRKCLRVPCPGFNVEQRHCNLFGCYNTVNPLAVEESRYFHPSKDYWTRVPDRPSAWRLTPNSYIWLPSAQLFANTTTGGPFPKEFALFITLRSLNNSLGTIFSLRSRRRQDTYLSLETAGSDLKLIHAAPNGTDVVRIPAQLDDGKWHQISVSIRDDSIVENYVDCEWSRTNILKKGSLDIPEDADLIIGYLFAGDIEQLTIDPNPAAVSLQCSTLITPIIDPSIGGKPTTTATAKKLLHRKKPSRKWH